MADWPRQQRFAVTRTQCDRPTRDCHAGSRRNVARGCHVQDVAVAFWRNSCVNVASEGDSQFVNGTRECTLSVAGEGRILGLSELVQHVPEAGLAVRVLE